MACSRDAHLPAYPVFVYLVVAGTTSAVNLTDGLDGLAAGCAAIVLLAHIGITFITPGEHDMTLLARCLVGACIAFLWFNTFPASIFMGDTDSRCLGGAIAGLAVMTKTELLLILRRAIFVIEALSVLIQVFSFRTFHKRAFLMAPIHHHFELRAWSETTIILRFWIVTAALGAVGFVVYQLDTCLAVGQVRGGGYASAGSGSEVARASGCSLDSEREDLGS